MIDPFNASWDTSRKLPDADLCCGPGYTEKVDDWSIRTPAGTVWITEETYGGH